MRPILRGFLPCDAAMPITAVVGILLGLYVGAYYLVVDQALYPSNKSGLWAPVPFYSDRLPVDCTRKVEWSDRIAPFFAPTHWLDRRLRAKKWEPRRLRGPWTVQPRSADASSAPRADGIVELMCGRRGD